MDLNPYSPCPCGSGKQFKWCCQPIHRQLAQVFDLEEEGQHAAAMRSWMTSSRQNPANPEAHGQRARLLFQNEKPEEAEQALEKAFEINPNYAFGYFLKARFRLYEGEIAGALILLRKAAELYAPEAHEMLAMVYVEIFDCEMKLNQPIAARAAAELAQKHNPADERLRKGIEQVFGADNPNLPEGRRPRSMSSRRCRPRRAAERKAAWKQALADGGHRQVEPCRAGVRAARRSGRERRGRLVQSRPGACLARAQCRRAGSARSLRRAGSRTRRRRPGRGRWPRCCGSARGWRIGRTTSSIRMLFALRDPQPFMNVLGVLEPATSCWRACRVNEEEGMLSAAVLEPPPPALTPELEARPEPHASAPISS